MTVIHNLCTNPALKIDNSPATWFGPSSGVGPWARSAALHASLPRQTGWTGSTPGDPVVGRASVTPGKYYSVTVSARFVAPSAGNFQVDWKTSGNAYIATQVGQAYSQAGATTVRLGGVVLAPATADHMDIVVQGVDGEAQLTATMVREFDDSPSATAALAVDILPANYADGDSTGGVWDGTSGKSTSTITRNEPASGEALFAALVASGYGVRTTFGTGEALFGPLLASSGLILSAQYNRAKGKIRIQAEGLAGDVVRAIVYSRPTGTSRWALVRGGKVSVTAGALNRPIDDYEYRAGTGMDYRMDALSSTENQPDHIVQTSHVSTIETEERVWLKFIPAPWTNVPVNLVLDNWQLGQDSRSTVHEVQGETPPVVVSDLHSSTRTSIRLITYTDAELAALRRALSQGAPAYLQVPDAIPFPTMYVSIGRITPERWGGINSRRYITTVELIEVAAPPPSVVPKGITWAILAQQYATWADVAAAFNTWGEVVG